MASASRGRQRRPAGWRADRRFRVLDVVRALAAAAPYASEWEWKREPRRTLPAAPVMRDRGGADERRRQISDFLGGVRRWIGQQAHTVECELAASGESLP